MSFYDEFKRLRLEFDKKRYMYPQDGDQMKGIRRDFALFQYIIKHEGKKEFGPKLIDTRNPGKMAVKESCANTKLLCACGKCHKCKEEGGRMSCKLFCWFGWHIVREIEGWNGNSFQSYCVMCKKRVLQDSQGNWFTV